MIRDAFDVLYAEGEESGRVMAICLHPYLYGQPHRIKHLDRALGYILEHDGVWQATGTQIADWSRQHWLPQLESHFEQFAGERNVPDQTIRYRHDGVTTTVITTGAPYPSAPDRLAGKRKDCGLSTCLS